MSEYPHADEFGIGTEEWLRNVEQARNNAHLRVALEQAIASAHVTNKLLTVLPCREWTNLVFAIRDHLKSVSSSME